MDTIRKTTQWVRPTQRIHSAGGPGPQVVDTPMMRRGSDASSSHSHHSRSSGAGNHRLNAADVSAIVCSPPDADAPPPPLGSTPAAPSYRTAVHLSNNSATAVAGRSGGNGGVHLQRGSHATAEALPTSARAPASTVSSAGGVDPTASAAEDHEEVYLPPNWHKRITAENRPCELALVWYDGLQTWCSGQPH